MINTSRDSAILQDSLRDVGRGSDSFCQVGLFQSQKEEHERGSRSMRWKLRKACSEFGASAPGEYRIFREYAVVVRVKLSCKSLRTCINSPSRVVEDRGDSNHDSVKSRRKYSVHSIISFYSLGRQPWCSKA